MLFLVIWIGLQVLGAAAGFSQAGGGSEGGVAYFAHVGGFIFGLAAVRSLDPGGEVPNPWRRRRTPASSALCDRRGERRSGATGAGAGRAGRLPDPPLPQ